MIGASTIFSRSTEKGDGVPLSPLIFGYMLVFAFISIKRSF